MKETDLLREIDLRADLFNKTEFTDIVTKRLLEKGYVISEINADKPWGAYIRINNDQSAMFIGEFFPGLSLKDARLGLEGVELSPKVLIVTPGERLSWQYHHRRAERWVFLTRGSYNKSLTDEPGDAYEVEAGGVVQFERSERHRLNSLSDSVVVVAEIWQHTDTDVPSDEDDIVRLIDDYNR